MNKAPQFSISKHFLEKHNKDATLLKVFGIQNIGPKSYEGDRFKVLCNQETYWIFKLGCLAPKGFNLASARLKKRRAKCLETRSHGNLDDVTIRNDLLGLLEL